MDKTIKLRKCPFCGSEVHLYKRRVFFSSLAYQVGCLSCKATVSPVLTGLCANGHRVTDKEAIQKAIDKWNNPCIRK